MNPGYILASIVSNIVLKQSFRIPKKIQIRNIKEGMRRSLPNKRCEYISGVCPVYRSSYYRNQLKEATHRMFWEVQQDMDASLPRKPQKVEGSPSRQGL